MKTARLYKDIFARNEWHLLREYATYLLPPPSPSGGGESVVEAGAAEEEDEGMSCKENKEQSDIERSCTSPGCAYK